ncbi:regulator of G-protein signaling 12-like isoform X1 [Anguilla rostrata]|uniref:regulator of G-protein signaling 12-like isoform X1 n=1 Tax=Anguilla rostrata TaxID=7938 RepID=UPI0030CADF47
MFRRADTAKRRVNPPPAARGRGAEVARGRSVELARGRGGYGFTLSGQAPCVLSSVLRASPGRRAGLRPGDRVLSVNQTDVSRASHADVVELVGRCHGVLRLVVAPGDGPPDSCSSDEELGSPPSRAARLRPKTDARTLGISRAERVVADMQAGGIFGMMLESAAHPPAAAAKPRPRSEPDFHRARSGSARSYRDSLEEEAAAGVLNGDSVLAGAFGSPWRGDCAPDVPDVGMVVGYLGSIELASAGASLESASLQAIRGCMRRLRAEQRVHALVMMRIARDGVRLCSDRGGVLATYPADKLAFSAVCPDDRRFFGLVTMQAADGRGPGREEEGRGPARQEEEEGGLRTSCHVFTVDPELCHHTAHQGVARRFGFACTPDPDTGGCLEFPPTSQPVLQFVSVLYRDMGESIEGVRARAFLDGDLDAQLNHSTSSNSDSGIGHFLPEEKSGRVLLVDLGAGPNRHAPGGPRENPAAGPPHNGYRYDPDAKRHPLEPPPPYPDPSALGGRAPGPPRTEPPPPAPPPRAHPSRGKKAGGAEAGHSGGGQRWLPVHVLRDWRRGRGSDRDSCAESTDGWSSANCSTLPPPMSKIPADRYRAAGEPAQPPRPGAQKDEWARKLFGADRAFRERLQGKHGRDAEKKGSRFRGVTVGFPQLPLRSSGRRSFGRSKRLSMARSLDDLESAAVSDGELNSGDLKGCGSENSLSSNASLPSVQSHRRHGERRVASWAACFERLLQDPVGVRYFSEFLKKEFSEENILFWQACEFFSSVPETDKKQLSQRAREIYNSFLSSKATTPVNIDSQAQLADDILNAPRPDMFKEQQLQIFNLMKFDSYTRFLKSFLYQECMLSEVEGRPLPDPYHIPSSPVSKHSTSSDRSNLSTPRKEDKKSKSGRSLNDESRDEHADKRKGIFFSWSRNRSFGKGPKKKELTDFNYNFAGSNGRRASQGSLSSGASLELATCSSGGKNEGDVSRHSMSLLDRERVLKNCTINMPDGSCCSLPLRPGLSVREVLLGLCEKLGINLAAVDLFLVGGEKPLVMDQDCVTLSARDLRLEKRTLFRLDLVPINRSVGLKAKPTKPVTEVLRPVVAKYGLHLADLVATVSGESEPLDLGLPISNLDGLRVVLDLADHARGKDQQTLAAAKSHPQTATARSQAATGDESQSGKCSSMKARGESARDPPKFSQDQSVRKERRKHKHINIDEAEEFFELISKAQSNRADDQRGLLNKDDLVLPDFLRLAPEPSCSTPRRGKENGGAGGALNAAHHSLSLDSTPPGPPGPSGPHRDRLPFAPPLSPIPRNADPRAHPPWPRSGSDWRGESVQMVEDESLGDLTLVGEGDITSPNSTLLPPSPLPGLHPHGLSLSRYAPPPDSRANPRSSSGTSGV